MIPLTLSAIGATPAVAILDTIDRHGGLPPGIGVTLSDGAVLTYVVEVTFDGVSGYSAPQTTLWVLLGNASYSWGSLGVSASFGLPFKVSAVRARVLSYISGTLSFQVAQ